MDIGTAAWLFLLFSPLFQINFAFPFMDFMVFSLSCCPVKRSPAQTTDQFSAKHMLSRIYSNASGRSLLVPDKLLSFVDFFIGSLPQFF